MVSSLSTSDVVRAAAAALAAVAASRCCRRGARKRERSSIRLTSYTRPYARAHIEFDRGIERPKRFRVTLTSFDPPVGLVVERRAACRGTRLTLEHCPPCVPVSRSDHLLPVFRRHALFIVELALF